MGLDGVACSGETVGLDSAVSLDDTHSIDPKLYLGEMEK